MTHKLLITFTLDPKEVTQGIPFKVILQIKNIGDEFFPGGR